MSQGRAVLRSAPGGREIVVDPPGPAVFGRSREVEIRVDDDSVSRRHASLEWTGSRLFLSDLGSNNGTFLNGVRIEERVRVRDGDVIRLGPAEAFHVTHTAGGPGAGRWFLPALVLVVVAGAGIALLSRTGGSQEAADREVLGTRVEDALQALAAGTERDKARARDLLETAIDYAAGRLEGMPTDPKAILAEIQDRIDLDRPDLRVVYEEVRRVERGRIEFRDARHRKAVLRRLSRQVMMALGLLPGDIPPDFLEEVEDQIEFYLRMKETPETLERSKRYRGPAERAFAERGLPEELIWVSMVESAFIPTAQSTVRAAGLWQFMPATAREYGLSVDPAAGVDQRLEPEAATPAAARYLEDLIRISDGDVLLALASYNAGPGTLRKWQRELAFARKGKFWELRKQYKETAIYVPRVVAAAVVGRNADILLGL